MRSVVEREDSAVGVRKLEMTFGWHHQGKGTFEFCWEGGGAKVACLGSFPSL
jgi:hypothetical protein